jgi:hypothetical protein
MVEETIANAVAAAFFPELTQRAIIRHQTQRYMATYIIYFSYLVSTENCHNQAKHLQPKNYCNSDVSLSSLKCNLIKVVQRSIC